MQIPVIRLFTTAVLAAGLLAARPAHAEITNLAQRIARFAPTTLNGDISHLSEGDQKALAKIIAAAKLMDPLYLRQVWGGNAELEKRLQADQTPAGREKLHYFRINCGPWSRLDENQPFVDGVPAKKPAGAGFYPEDMTKDEFNSWLKTLPADEARKAQGFFWLVRRGTDKKLFLVPYSQEYQEFLKPAAQLLEEASALTTNASLKKFLKLRAESFHTDDYFASDVAWMELDSPIDVTFGPYETYEDDLFGFKACFEAYVTLRDDAETAKLGRFSSYLQELEDHLPIDPKYRNPKIGSIAAIRVVTEVLSSGEGRRGVQTAAFNLPNDERVVKEKGSKRVMLKNVQEGKFNKILLPISKVVLQPDQLKEISFDSFFTHILMHELMHGIGPHELVVDGKKVEVRKQLESLHAAIEEAKADITGLWALQYLVDKKALSEEIAKTMYTTYLASMFRSVRFGLTEAHGKGIALQFNYMWDAGAIIHNPKLGTFAIDPAKVRAAVTGLTRELLTIEAEGSKAKAQAILDRLGVVRPPMQAALDRLKDVPVDIEPDFPQAR
jgi:hypothetical protein